jgi:uncharacterized protein YdeI (YjbR/CyaY-like superfamily)
MKELQNMHFNDRAAFRAWLEDHHQQKDGIWMLYYKNKLQPCLSYREALEEALCFGWIDSTVKRIDEEKYVRMFTPRRNISNWSDINKQLVIELIRSGRMTEAGLLKIDVYQKTGRIDWEINTNPRPEKKEKLVMVPDDIRDAMMLAEPAWTYFMSLSPSHRQRYLLWITAARRDETRQRRIREAVEVLKNQQVLGMK